MLVGKIESRERPVATMPNAGPKTGESHPEIRDAVRKLCARLLERAGPRAGLIRRSSSTLLASEASWHAADTSLQTHGSFGFAEEYDIERKFRETRLYQVASISTNLILSHVGTHVLGLPKSF